MKALLKPLTPLWTGNNDGLSDQFRATGLMGSLRWWWEGLVRSYELYACDPTGKDACLKERGKPLCAGCLLFGATGWARRFRLTTGTLMPEPWYVLAHPQIARMHENWLKRVMKPGAMVLWGECLDLDFEQYLEDSDSMPWSQVETCLQALLKVVCRHGAIGAKAQNGHGVVELIGDYVPVRRPLEQFLLQDGKLKAGTNDSRWFDLARTAFLTFDVPDPGAYARSAVRIPAQARARYDHFVLPVAYELRYKSESSWRGQGRDVGLRPALKDFLRTRGIESPEEIVGSTARSDARTASRVFVSHLYRQQPSGPYKLRMWVHVPCGMNCQPWELAQFVAQYVTENLFPGSHAVCQGWDEIKEGL